MTAARLAASLAAMGLVFVGAIVMPVYLVPALTAVLALGLAAEPHPGWGPAISSRLHTRAKCRGGRHAGPGRIPRAHLQPGWPNSRGCRSRTAAGLPSRTILPLHWSAAGTQEQAGKAQQAPGHDPRTAAGVHGGRP
jgi:hypothetical protein